MAATVLNLKLEGKELDRIPSEVLLAVHCVRLNLASNQITSLPSSISKLTNLRILRLDHNQISSIPESIVSLQSLETLNLAYNRIVNLPRSIGSLGKLTHLYLAHNALTELPWSMHKLSSLRTLSIEPNPLTFPPCHVWRLPGLAARRPDSKETIDRIRKYLRMSVACNGNEGDDSTSHSAENLKSNPGGFVQSSDTGLEAGSSLDAITAASIDVGGHKSNPVERNEIIEVSAESVRAPLESTANQTKANDLSKPLKNYPYTMSYSIPNLTEGVGGSPEVASNAAAGSVTYAGGYTNTMRGLSGSLTLSGIAGYESTVALHNLRALSQGVEEAAAYLSAENIRLLAAFQSFAAGQIHLIFHTHILATLHRSLYATAAQHSVQLSLLASLALKYVKCKMPTGSHKSWSSTTQTFNLLIKAVIAAIAGARALLESLQQHAGTLDIRSAKPFASTLFQSLSELRYCAELLASLGAVNDSENSSLSTPSI